MDVGFELRQARERQGTTLQQISTITKITPRVLQAIEASDESRLPAPVFTRGFVKAYAREVGLDPEDMVARYMGQFHPIEAVEVEPAREIEPPHQAPDLRTVALAVLAPRTRLAALTVAAIVLVGLLAAIVERHSGSPVTPPKSAVMAAGVASAAASQETPVGTTGASSPSTAPADGPLKIAIAPSGPCWVQATVGETRLFATLLNAGDRKTFDAPSDVTLRVGDPGTFAFTVNGHPGKTVGATRQAVTVHIDRNNYRDFLAR